MQATGRSAKALKEAEAERAIAQNTLEAERDEQTRFGHSCDNCMGIDPDSCFFNLARFDYPENKRVD